MRLHLGTHRAICAWAIILDLVLLVMASPSRAQPVDIPATWGGDFWSRPHAHQAKALVMDLLHRVRVDTYWDAFFVGSSGTPQRGSV